MIRIIDIKYSNLKEKCKGRKLFNFFGYIFSINDFCLKFQLFFEQYQGAVKLTNYEKLIYLGERNDKLKRLQFDNFKS